MLLITALPRLGNSVGLSLSGIFGADDRVPAGYNYSEPLKKLDIV